MTAQRKPELQRSGADGEEALAALDSGAAGAEGASHGGSPGAAACDERMSTPADSAGTSGARRPTEERELGADEERSVRGSAAARAAPLQRKRKLADLDSGAPAPRNGRCDAPTVGCGAGDGKRYRSGTDAMRGRPNGHSAADSPEQLLCSARGADSQGAAGARCAGSASASTVLRVRVGE
jgi:hypothetical protein